MQSYASHSLSLSPTLCIYNFIYIMYIAHYLGIWWEYPAMCIWLNHMHNVSTEDMNPRGYLRIEGSISGFSMWPVMAKFRYPKERHATDYTTNNYSSWSMASPTERCQGRAMLHANHMMVSIKALCIPLAGNGDDGFLGSRSLGKKRSTSSLALAWSAIFDAINISL